MCSCRLKSSENYDKIQSYFKINKTWLESTQLQNLQILRLPIFRATISSKVLYQKIPIEIAQLQQYRPSHCTGKYVNINSTCCQHPLAMATNFDKKPPSKMLKTCVLTIMLPTELYFPSVGDKYHRNDGNIPINSCHEHFSMSI